MYLNGYSVRVPGGSEQSSGYVELRHNQKYTLILRNQNAERCDAYVEIDGKHVGTWRLASHQAITLERPAHDSGKFTFYKAGTKEAKKSGLRNVSPQKLGLVAVTYTPEVRVSDCCDWSNIIDDSSFLIGDSGGDTGDFSPQVNWTMSVNSCTTNYSTAGATRGLSAGGTGLSGHSKQEFHEAEDLNLDYTRTTTINLRLVAKERIDQGPRPLTQYSNPVPPPMYR